MFHDLLSNSCLCVEIGQQLIIHLHFKKYPLISLSWIYCKLSCFSDFFFLFEISRVAPAPVVGWPPIRSFRKNLASSSNSKQTDADLPNKTPTEGCKLKPESFRNDLYVKINMEGVPIGRKINLNAYDSYEKLSVAIDELFRGLLAGYTQTQFGFFFFFFLSK